MSVCVTGVSEIALALLTTMSKPPNVAAVLSIAAFTASSSRTSTASGSALPPAFSISAAAVWMVPSSLGCGSTVLAAMATLAPSAAALSAIASPIPREPPVTKSVFPFSDMRVSAKFRVSGRNDHSGNSPSPSALRRSAFGLNDEDNWRASA